MATEKSLRYLISQYAKKIKRLRGELEGTVARKKEAEVQLRERRWEAKEEKKRKLWIEKKTTKPYPEPYPEPYPDRIDKAIETMAEKILKKATKKVAKKKV